MKKDFRIITNNPLVREKLGQDYQVEFTNVHTKMFWKK